MKHQEIRFQILHYLYNKHYGGEVGKYQKVNKIIEETELKNVEPDLVIGDVAYLNEGKFIKGIPVRSHLGYPRSIVITCNGIDAVENVIGHIIKNINNPENVNNPEIQKHQKEIETRANVTNPKNRINGIFEYVKANPGFFATYMEKAATWALTMSGGVLT